MSLFVDLLDNDPSFSLDNALDYASSEYDKDFAEFWGLHDNEPPEDLPFEAWRDLGELWRLAGKLAQGAETLIRPPKTKKDQLALPKGLESEAQDFSVNLRQMLGDLKKKFPETSETKWKEAEAILGQPLGPSDPRFRLRFFHNCMEVEAFKRFSGWPYFLAQRMIELLDCLVRNPGEFTQAYLPRVAECYVRDMTTEFAVMTRAALELAIADRITPMGVRIELHLHEEADVNLARQIQACEAKGWFEVDETRAAHRIRKTGNDAAHGEPVLTGGPKDLLEDFSLVLRRLDGLKGEATSLD